MLNINELNWEKVNGLLPVIIQDCDTQQVLMLGYMNAEALEQTCTSKKVTFYSRSKQRLWTKGETSGHELSLVSITADCDNDALLIQAKPHGPTCHLNRTSCFGDADRSIYSILAMLERVIVSRYQQQPENSYVTKLFKQGVQRIAQKVGEEGVELALAGVMQNKEEIKNEAADLLFHMLVLLCQSGLKLNDVLQVLRQRQG